MTSRQEKILKEIIKSYIKSAQPIGSEYLLKKIGLDISPATMRNEMAALEEANYIYQPHTSAGRIPTEKGYQYYLDNFLNQNEQIKDYKNYFKNLKSKKTTREEFLKNLAKISAQISGQTIFISFSSHDTYYTGIFNLFSQPEFTEFDLVRNISQIIDNLDEIIGQLYPKMGREIEILIGRNNPFNPQLASILVMSIDKMMLGLIGPMRMDYGKNLSLIKSAKNFIER